MIEIDCNIWHSICFLVFLSFDGCQPNFPSMPLTVTLDTPKHWSEVLSSWSESNHVEYFSHHDYHVMARLTGNPANNIIEFCEFSTMFPLSLIGSYVLIISGLLHSPLLIPIPTTTRTYHTWSLPPSKLLDSRTSHLTMLLSHFMPTTSAVFSIIAFETTYART